MLFRSDHVDSHDHGDAQLDELSGQVQVALDVGAINDVQDGIGLLLWLSSRVPFALAGLGLPLVTAGRECSV